MAQLPVFVQNNIVQADSLLANSKDCWSQLEEDLKITVALSAAYLHHSSNQRNTNLQVLREHGMESNDPLIRLLNDGIPVTFGQAISDEVVDQALSFKQAANRQIKGIAHYFLALNELSNESFQDAENNFKQALELFKKEASGFLACKSYQGLSYIEVERNNYQKAFDYLLQSLDYASKNGLNYERAFTDKLIGELLLEMDNYQEAETHIRKGLTIAQRLKTLKLEADLLSNMGVVFLLKGSEQKAINHFSLALSKYYKIEDAQGIAQSHMRLGSVYKGGQSYKLSKENYLLSLGYLEEINDSLQLGDVFYSLAEIEFGQRNVQMAKSYITKSLNIRNQKGSRFDFHNALFLSARIHEVLGSHQSAFKDLLRYTTFMDSVQNTDLKAKIAELSELYQAEQNENLILQQSKELEELTIEGELREQKLENIGLRNRQMLFLLLAVLFAGFSIFVWYRFKRKQEKSSQLQKETELKQTVLRSQMNPHFIFNSMSVIQSYIYSKDTENSSLFIVNFSRLMRLILENSSKEFIPLSIELEILNKYLLIQQLRFEDRFDFDISTGDLDTSSIHVPPMLTQPFIENAIEHGRLETIEGGMIHIRFSLEDDLMKIVVEDNGVGKDTPKTKDESNPHTSMAIAITRERIELLNVKNNANGLLQILDKTEEGSSGTRVTILTYCKKLNE